MNQNIPPIVNNALRITINLEYAEPRLDKILLQALHDQNDNQDLKKVSRSGLKELFAKGKVLIKGQNAKPSSSLAKGITYIDIKLD